MKNPILRLILRFRDQLARIRPYYWLLAVLLAISGWFGMGTIGLLLAFWMVLLWYSVWQRPYRFEMFLIAALGLLGAVVILPEEQWLASNKISLLAFMAISMSPIIDLCIRLFRGNNEE